MEAAEEKAMGGQADALRLAADMVEPVTRSGG
jgi:hypothetical protein